MGKLRLTPAARKDIDSIWQFTAAHWNADQAETYVRALGRAMELLAASPAIGRSLDDIWPGCFKFPTASHVIYYRASADGISVIRILHKSMDAENHL